MTVFPLTIKEHTADPRKTSSAVPIHHIFSLLLKRIPFFWPRLVYKYIYLLYILYTYNFTIQYFSFTENRFIAYLKAFIYSSRFNKKQTLLILWTPRDFIFTLSYILYYIFSYFLSSFLIDNNEKLWSIWRNKSIYLNIF